MDTRQIQTWLAYWRETKEVPVDEIKCIQHMHLARQQRQCMRDGRFNVVSDIEMWRALLAMRRGQKVA